MAARNLPESPPGRQGFSVLPAALHQNAARVDRFASFIQTDLFDHHFRCNLPYGIGTLVNARVHRYVVRTRASHSHIAGDSIAEFAQNHRSFRRGGENSIREEFLHPSIQLAPPSSRDLSLLPTHILRSTH